MQICIRQKRTHRLWLESTWLAHLIAEGWSIERRGATAHGSRESETLTILYSRPAWAREVFDTAIALLKQLGIAA